MGKKPTPMFEQYLRFKELHPDALLFFRMGDFYELFFEDAEIAAREIGLTLTSRNPGDQVPIPMAGVPHHAKDGYAAQLLARGFKVAICDQIENPKHAKGLVRRAVTQVLTPGTVLEGDSLTAKRANHLAALVWDPAGGSGEGRGGLAWADVSTGHWTGIGSRREAELWQWVHKVEPSELLLPEGLETPPGFVLESGAVTRVPERSHFDLNAAREKLFAAQKVESLSVLDLQDKPELARACGALLTYLQHTQQQELSHLRPFRPLNLGRHLILDEVTERNLELFVRLDGKRGRGTLWQVLDATKTPMGGRLLAERLKHPWREAGSIAETQAVTALLVEADEARREAREALSRVQDLERLASRLALGRSGPRDLAALRDSLARLPELRAVFSALPEPPKALAAVLEHWDSLDEAGSLLDRALADSPPAGPLEGGVFRPGYDRDLDEVLELCLHGEDALTRMLEAEKAAAGVSKLKVGYNKVFGYYLEIPKSQIDLAPEHFERKQTLVNAERYITADLKELEAKLLSAEDRRKDLEYKLFLELRQELAGYVDRLVFMAGAVAALDYWQCLAETARHNAWVRPELHQGLALDIKGGRHPVVEAVQGASSFIPNDLVLDEDARLAIITGPNMAGKSTVLRQTAIICILAQMGSFVPATAARLGLVDRVFSRVGASDNLARGQSTFMVEMTETARILRQAGPRSLVILDEIGRGTSTFDGLALAWAVVEALAGTDTAPRGAREGVRTLFATHYHELTSLEGRILAVRNLNIAVKEYGGEIIFLRRLVPGPSDRSYGIEVARLAGVPRTVVKRSQAILADLEAKARASGERVEARLAAQKLLPGMAPPPCATDEEPEPEPHPLQKVLAATDVDRLSPLEALNLLHQWKKQWSDS